MSFQVLLAQVVNGVEGSLSCMLMGQDGLAVETADHPSPPYTFDSSTYAIEYTGLFQNIFQINQRIGAGATNELMVRSDQVVALFHFLSPEYFLILTLAPNGNIGKGRYLLKTTASQLQKLL